MKYETTFAVKTDKKTKALIEQIMFKAMTDRGHFVMKAEVFGDLVKKWATQEQITL